MIKTNALRTPRRVSVSTWALHALLGTVAPGRPGDPEGRMMTPHEGDGGKTTLLDVPAALAARGIRTMEVCHFHLPQRDDAYVEQLRAAAEAAGVEIWSLLIDDGDITDPVNGERDRQWTLGWIETASRLGARCVRVIGGKQQPDDVTLARSREQLALLVMEAYVRGVHVLTENWFALLSQPQYVNRLLEELNGSVGLCLDFGNWDSHGEAKYEDLARIAAHATSCHAKCSFVDGVPNVDDYRRCLEITRAADFSGPYTLVQGEAADVWGSIAVQTEILAPFCVQ